MVGGIVTVVFCFGIALTAVFAWANAETKYKLQRKKIFELAHQLRSSQRDLRELQAYISSADSNTNKYRRTLAKVGYILANEDDAQERDEQISEVLSSNVPEMLPQKKQHREGITKRTQAETEEIFHRVRGQWSHA